MAEQTEIALGVGARSEKGRREDNQDKMTSFSTPLGTFYIVADGMGGHRGGAEASLSVVEGYRKHLQGFPEVADFADVLQHATTLTNAEILAAGRSGDPSIAGMGSTVVMAMLRTVPGGGAGTGSSGMEVLTAHIGDSRAYLLRGGAMTQLTHDHSAVQRMVDEQLISAEAAKTHPDLNVLTRALGKQAEIAIEVGRRVSLYPGDTILLCTDGLWGHVSDEQMAYELSVDRSTSETADVLVQMALDNGSDDNITLQILRLEDRNAMGRPIVASAVAAPTVLPAASASLLDVQRGRGATQGFASAPAMAAPAPVMRVEVGGAPRRRGSALTYLLLGVACICLGLGGLYFAKQFRKTKAKQPQPVVVNPQPCTNGKSNVPTCSGDDSTTARPANHGEGRRPTANPERPPQPQPQTPNPLPPPNKNLDKNKAKNQVAAEAQDDAN